MSTVAIVDDEETIRESVAFALRREGCQVDVYPDGGAAWDVFRRQLPDVMILDITMPRMDGLELCRQVRKVSDAVAIIFLTSRDEELDRVLGLELGADDYMCKPFSTRELVARVKVLLRRHLLGREVKEAEKPFQLGKLELDLQRYFVRWDGTPVDLTVTEFMMLHALVKHPGHVKTRKQLTRDGYQHDTFVSDRTIDSHIKRLRRKFEEVDAAFDRIETVYGVGYRYTAE